MQASCNWLWRQTELLQIFDMLPFMVEFWDWCRLFSPVYCFLPWLMQFRCAGFLVDHQLCPKDFHGGCHGRLLGGFNHALFMSYYLFAMMSQIDEYIFWDQTTSQYGQYDFRQMNGLWCRNQPLAATTAARPRGARAVSRRCFSPLFMFL